MKSSLPAGRHDENVTQWDDYQSSEIPGPTGFIRADM
jgi:hypothetical protein